MVPDTFNGLPTHSLSVHATVVLVPLAALLGVLFAVPRLRDWSAWPLPLVSVGAAVSTFVSTQSGEALKEVGGVGTAGLRGPVLDLVEEHQELAEQLQLLVFGYAVLALVVVLVWRRAARAAARAASAPAPGPGPDGSSGRPAAGGVLVTALSVLLVLGAVAVGAQTYRVGDAGAQAVWNPTDTVDYAE